MGDGEAPLGGAPTRRAGADDPPETAGPAADPDDPEDDDSGTATESLSDESASDDGDVDGQVNVEISQPGIAFHFKGKPG